MSSTYVFLVACVGAAAPEIVRLYRLRAHPQLELRWHYLIISVLFFALGGIVALILPVTTLWGAFYAGVSTPVLISRMAAKPVKSEELPSTRGEPSVATTTPGLREYLELI
jgi:hypothetical protein